MAYTLRSDGGVTRDADGALVPGDPNNSDRRAYEAWRSAGGVPNPVPAVVPVTPLVTGRQINGQASATGVTMALNALLTSPTAKKPDDVRYFNSVGLNTPVPVDNPKVGRVLTLAGVKDVPAFMAAALLLPA